MEDVARLDARLLQTALEAGSPASSAANAAPAAIVSTPGHRDGQGKLQVKPTAGSVMLVYETGLVAPGREEAPSRVARGENSPSQPGSQPT